MPIPSSNTSNKTIFNLLILLFYSINLFTEKGIGIPKNIEVKEYNDDLNTDDENDIYKVQ